MIFDYKITSNIEDTCILGASEVKVEYLMPLLVNFVIPRRGRYDRQEKAYQRQQI